MSFLVYKKAKTCRSKQAVDIIESYCTTHKVILPSTEHKLETEKGDSTFKLLALVSATNTKNVSPEGLTELAFS
jgi:hypothetical protein